MSPQENDQTTASSRVDGPRLIIIGLIAVILLLFGVLLAQCGNEGNSGQATQVVAADASSTTELPATTVPGSTTTQTPTTVVSSTTTTETPATTTTEAPQPVFDCTLTVENGELIGLAIWAEEDPPDVATAVAAITDLCGEPDSDTGWYHACLMDIPPDQVSDEKPLRSIVWGGLDLTFRRGYELQRIDPPTVDDQGYPVVAPAEPSWGPTLYTDSGFLAKWNYYGLGDGTQVQLALDGGSVGDPMAEVLANLSLGVDDIDEWAFDAFGAIVVTGPDGVTYVSQSGPSDGDMTAAVENAVLTSIGWLQYCH